MNKVSTLVLKKLIIGALFLACMPALHAQTNVALYDAGDFLNRLASASSTSQAASFVNDGNKSAFTEGWASDGSGMPEWVQIDFTSAVTINKIVLYFIGPSRQGMSYQVQTWNGSSWDTQESVTESAETTHTSWFSEVSTTKIRINFTHGMDVNENYAHCTELEAYNDPSGPPTSGPDVSLSAKNTDCYGGSDGIASSSVSNGTSPYTYLWSTGATTADITGIAAGVYTLTVTDDASESTTATTTITEPAQLSLTSENPTDVTCFGYANGQLAYAATGGTGTINYNIGSGQQTSGTFTGLAPTSYIVTISDANACIATGTSQTISEPSQLSITGENNTDVTGCQGDANGTLSYAASGGTGTVTFDIGSASNTTGSFSSLSSNDYVVTISDANSCTAVGTTQNISEPAALGYSSLSKTDLSSCISTDGEIHITGTGGTGTHYYDLGAGSNTSGDFTGLAQGSYTITISDDQSCEYVAPAVDINPTGAPSITGETPTDITCNGITDGKLSITATGGTGTLTYDLGGAIPTNTDGNFTGLSASSYTVTVTDANSCEVIGTAQSVSEPSQVTINNITLSNPDCYGEASGQIQIAAIGGTGTLQYKVTGEGQQTSSTFSNLGSGTYTISVSDANNCQVTATNKTLTDPAQLSITTESVTDISCNGDNDGTLSYAATGGTGTLSYDIGTASNTTGNFTGLSANSYTLTVTDTKSCKATGTAKSVTEPNSLAITNLALTDPNCYGGSTGQIQIAATGGTGTLKYKVTGESQQTANTFTGLGSGTYTISVSDANNCQVTATNKTLTDPAMLSITAETATDISCNGDNDGELSYTATGGTGTLNYNIGAGSQTSSSFTGLSNGNYTLTVTDSKGCNAIGTQQSIADPSALGYTSLTTAQASCGTADGEIHISGSGGTGTLNYDLGTGTNTTGDFTSLASNNYYVTITDGNSCSYVSPLVQVTEAGAPVITVEQVVSNATCNGDSDGELAYTATGGTGTLTYDIGTASNTTGNFTGLSANSYTLTVTDAASCKALGTPQAITEPAAIVADAGAAQDICAGESITLTASGGSSYAWSNGVSQSTAFAPDSTITYTVTVTEGSCSATDQVTVTVNAQPDVVLSSDTDNDTLVIGQQAKLTASGANTYTWSDTTITGSFVDISPSVNTTYSITGTDVNSCTSTDELTIIVVQADDTDSTDNPTDTNNVDTTAIYDYETIQLRMYPNPTSGKLFIDASVRIESAELISPSGTKAAVYAPLRSSEIDLTGLKPGSYYLRLKTEQGTVVRKIVLIK